MVNMMSTHCRNADCSDCNFNNCQHFCHGDRQAKGYLTPDLERRAEKRIKRARRGGGLRGNLVTYGSSYKYVPNDGRRY